MASIVRLQLLGVPSVRISRQKYRPTRRRDSAFASLKEDVEKEECENELRGNVVNDICELCRSERLHSHLRSPIGIEQAC